MSKPCPCYGPCLAGDDRCPLLAPDPVAALLRHERDSLATQLEQMRRERDEAREQTLREVRACETEMQCVRRDLAEARAKLAAALDVVKMARRLDAYDWQCRLDDSAVSEDAKHDARELGIALFHYDRRIIDEKEGGQ